MTGQYSSRNFEIGLNIYALIFVAHRTDRQSSLHVTGMSTMRNTVH